MKKFLIALFVFSFIAIFGFAQVTASKKPIDFYGSSKEKGAKGFSYERPSSNADSTISEYLFDHSSSKKRKPVADSQARAQAMTHDIGRDEILHDDDSSSSNVMQGTDKFTYANDTLVSMPPMSIAQYNELGKDLDKFNDKEWIAQQIANLTDKRNLILSTLMAARGKDPAKFTITGFDPKTNSLIVKLKLTPAIIK